MFEIAEYIGTIAFAMSGFFVGVRVKHCGLFNGDTYIFQISSTPKY